MTTHSKEEIIIHGLTMELEDCSRKSRIARICTLGNGPQFFPGLLCLNWKNNNNNNKNLIYLCFINVILKLWIKLGEKIPKLTSKHRNLQNKYFYLQFLVLVFNKKSNALPFLFILLLLNKKWRLRVHWLFSPQSNSVSSKTWISFKS